MRVLVIGAGNMGYTYAEGISKSNLLKHRIMLMDTSAEKVDEIKQIPYFEVYSDLSQCVPNADLIFIAVKPNNAADLFLTLKPLLSEQQILLSIMAGVKIERLKEMSGLTKIVRAMPNLPAKVGFGMTSYITTPAVSSIEAEAVESLLNTTGLSIRVTEEKFIDASTGISGSGPAYVFYFMQSMMESAEKMGFSHEDAKKLVAQTFLGTINLFNEYSDSPQTWIDRVTSKGGTTKAAMDSFEINAVSQHISEAAFAAFYRAEELGNEF